MLLSPLLLEGHKVKQLKNAVSCFPLAGFHAVVNSVSSPAYKLIISIMFIMSQGGNKLAA